MVKAGNGLSFLEKSQLFSRACRGLGKKNGITARILGPIMIAWLERNIFNVDRWGSLSAAKFKKRLKGKGRTKEPR